METFIYLLITIVILVLSMRKKKPVEPVGEETTSSPDPFSDLFREDDDSDVFIPETKQVTQAPPADPYQNQAGPWMSEVEAQDMVIDAEAVMKEAAENNPIAQFEGQLEEFSYEIEVSQDKGVPFDLKKAVIYSEILERRTI